MFTQCRKSRSSGRVLVRPEICGDRHVCDLLRRLPGPVEAVAGSMRGSDLHRSTIQLQSNYEVFWGEAKEKRAFDDRHASTQAYLEFMRPRCVELARVMKKTGSLYYHCDWRWCQVFCVSNVRR